MWNYRAIKDKDGCISVHEVYYDDDGNIISWTTNPITFVSMVSLDELTEDMERAINDIKKYPILNLENIKDS